MVRAAVRSLDQRLGDQGPPPAAQASGGQLTMVFNWFEELRRLVPLPK
jgi:hypothetical protein